MSALMLAEPAELTARAERVAQACKAYGISDYAPAFRQDLLTLARNVRSINELWMSAQREKRDLPKFREEITILTFYENLATALLAGAEADRRRMALNYLNIYASPLVQALRKSPQFRLELNCPEFEHSGHTIDVFGKPNGEKITVARKPLRTWFITWLGKRFDTLPGRNELILGPGEHWTVPEEHRILSPRLEPGAVIAAFRKDMADGKFKDKIGQFAAYVDGKLVATGPDKVELFFQVREKHPRTRLFIQPICEIVPIQIRGGRHVTQIR